MVAYETRCPQAVSRLNLESTAVRERAAYVRGWIARFGSRDRGLDASREELDHIVEHLVFREVRDFALREILNAA